MRALAVLLFCASTAALASDVVIEWPHRVHIDLDRPGAFASLRTDNPEHFARVREIISKAEALPNAPTPEWMRSNFDARDVFAIPMWQVSDPPKMTLSFRLDDVRYSTTIVGRYRPQLTYVR